MKFHQSLLANGNHNPLFYPNHETLSEKLSAYIQIRNETVRFWLIWSRFKKIFLRAIQQGLLLGANKYTYKYIIKYIKMLMFVYLYLFALRRRKSISFALIKSPTLLLSARNFFLFVENLLSVYVYPSPLTQVLSNYTIKDRNLNFGM